MADDQTIRVQRPDGKFSIIPIAAFPIARSKGYTLAPPKVAAPQVPVPSELMRPESLAEFPGKVLDRVGQNFKAMGDVPTNFLKDSRQRFKDAPGWPQKVAAPVSAELEVLKNIGKGIYSTTTPGILGRMADKDKPENIAGDASMFFMPGGEEGAARTYKPADLTKAGSLWGAKTRAVQAFDRIGKAVGDVPVDHAPAMEWANKAIELGKRGFKIPKPVSDFVAWVNEKSNTKATPISGQRGEFMDTPGSSMPVNYQVARDFKTAIREAVPWDEYGGKNGKMFNLAKEMERALDKSIVESLKPYDLDITYRRANAEYAKAMKARARAFGLGYVGGKVAGYGAGSMVGHPLLLGYGGGKAGESLAGSMVRSITEQ